MDVRVIDSLDEFVALGPRYATLNGGAARHSPFSSHRWLAAWWQSYHRVGRIRAFCIYDDDGLALMLPQGAS